MSEFREAGFDLTFPVKPEAAIAWAESRGIVLPKEFYQYVEELAGQAFTVSYLATLDEIKSVQDSLIEALDEGITLKEWKKRASETLDGLTDAHQEVIFRNAMQQAYSAARWLQIEQTKDKRPYLLFDGVNDSRQTNICRHLDGLIRPVDDPIWSSRSPQLHHNCRSVMISLTAAQAERRSATPGTGTQMAVPEDIPPKGWGKRPDKKQLDTLEELYQKRLDSQPPVIREAFKQIDIPKSDSIQFKGDDKDEFYSTILKDPLVDESFQEFKISDNLIDEDEFYKILLLDEETRKAFKNFKLSSMEGDKDEFYQTIMANFNEHTIDGSD